MKYNLTLFMMPLLFTTVTQAQISKSDKLFGGSFNASFSRYENTPSTNSSSNLGFSPTFAWAIKKNLVMGIKGTLGFNRNKHESGAIDSETTGTYIQPGIFFTKYKTLKNQFGVVFTHDIYMAYSQNQTKTGNIKSSNDSRSAGYGFSPGVFYKFSENFFGTANFGGVNAGWSKSDVSKGFSANISFLQAFQLGIQYRVGKRK